MSQLQIEARFLDGATSESFVIEGGVCAAGHIHLVVGASDGIVELTLPRETVLSAAQEAIAFLLGDEEVEQEYGDVRNDTPHVIREPHKRDLLN